MWQRTGSIWTVIAAGTLLLWGCGGGSHAPAAITDVKTLSNRADLISGGDALVEVVLPQGIDPTQVAVRLNGNDVSSKFALSKDGRLIGLVDQLVVGSNTLSASIGSTGRRRELVITNHAIGGPIFSGPQIQPWPCTTEENGLGPATDVQCNAPTRYKFVYKDATSGEFKAYDKANPPPAASIAQTTTDQGKTVPYIVRIETGTINRSIYDVAVLFDPSQPWTAGAPQAAWNGKLQWEMGCDARPGFSQGTNRACFFTFNALPPDEQVLMTGGAPDYALSRGFAVAASTQTNLGNDLNTVVHAETLMMVKEHIAEQYGSIRYTIGQGGSGGAIGQYMIANQYPGLLDGIRMNASFPDVWSVYAVNSFDCPLLNNYFDNISPSLWTKAQQDAVYGFGVGQPGQSGTDQCHGSGAVNFPWATSAWDPTTGLQPAPLPGPCVPDNERYDPVSNPKGVRCSPQDYMVNVFGRRTPDLWGPVEQKNGQGFANRFLDRVGVQYGLKALKDGVITPEQFVDLNEKIGGWDIDARWQAKRTEADPGAVSTMYRSGQLVEGYQLANVPIIDYRQDRRNDLHSNRQADYPRERMLKANGTVANRAVWIGPPPDPSEFGDVLQAPSFLAMDQWLAQIEADHSDLPLPQKIIHARPTSAADGCFASGQRVADAMCSQYALDLDPMLVAGMPATRDVLKCQLMPLLRTDYNVVFTDAQWARLNNAFSSGVCDWSKPGVGQAPNVPWLSYAGGPGGQPLGPAPTSSK